MMILNSLIFREKSKVPMLKKSLLVLSCLLILIFPLIQLLPEHQYYSFDFAPLQPWHKNATETDAHFVFGMSKHEITGALWGESLFGYGRFDQFSQGLHTRLYARAFVIEESSSGKLLAIVVADLGMISYHLKARVLERLGQLMPGHFFHENLMIMATHTHSAPASFAMENYYNLTNFGYSERNSDLVSEGIAEAIRTAFSHRTKGELYLSQGELLNTSINRSLDAFRSNPGANTFTQNTNKIMTQINFVQKKRVVGLLNFFAVHPTSISNHQKVISSDNKGLASLILEKENPDLIAAFANGDEGDVSPNIFPVNSPLSDFEKNRIIATKQAEKAKELIHQGIKLNPHLSVRYQLVNMPQYKVHINANQSIQLCRPGYGLSFAAGAEDGPSDVPGLKEGLKVGDRVRSWIGVLNSIVGGLYNGSSLDQKCHAPKPLFVHHGKIFQFPLELPFQIFTIGELGLLAVPSEMTTFAGHNLRQSLQPFLLTEKIKTLQIAGLSNAYSGYTATFEEYQQQHYEGASTLYGPYTLQAYQEIFRQMLERPETLPAHFETRPFSDGHQSSAFIFSKKLLKSEQALQIPTIISPGKAVEFIIPDLLPPRGPRSFLYAIEKTDGGIIWKATDDTSDHNLLQWKKDSSDLFSERLTAHITWFVPLKTAPGQYQLRYLNAENQIKILGPFTLKK